MTLIIYIKIIFCNRFSVGSASSGDTDIQYIKASELFPKKPPWIEGDVSCVTTPPFPQMPGEYITYEVIMLISASSPIFGYLVFKIKLKKKKQKKKHVN